MEKEAIIKHLKDNGLYIVKRSDFESLITLYGKAYEDYPLYVYLYGGKNDEEGCKQTIRVNLNLMFDEGIIYADSEELNGFVIVLPPGYTGISTLSFIWNGGFWIIYNQGIRTSYRMINFESFAMNLKKNIQIMKIGIYIIYV
jgi:hypothetical protein